MQLFQDLQNLQQNASQGLEHMIDNLKMCNYMCMHKWINVNTTALQMDVFFKKMILETYICIDCCDDESISGSFSGPGGFDECSDRLSEADEGSDTSS